MNSAHRFASQLPLALAYFLAASLAAGLTSFDGGVAFLWVANALVIADLMSRPRRAWVSSLAPCAVASFLATGLFGLGWAMAAPFALINMTEALVAVWLFRRHGNPLQPLGSLSWLMHFIVAAGVLAPLFAGGLAGAVLWATGAPFAENSWHFFTGHALGNLTIAPLALLVARGAMGKAGSKARKRFATEGAMLFTIIIATCVIVFSQSSYPLLFLPILPIILTTFRLGRGGAAAAIVLLALIGGGATLAGFGPIHLAGDSFGPQTQFFQFYLAATVLTVLPVAADLEKRRRLHRAVRLSEERYRLLAEHSTDILIHFTRTGRIRYVSPSIRSFGGHDPGTLIGQDSRTLVVPEHLQHVRDNYRAMLAASDQTRTFDFLAATADGSTRWYETHSRAILEEDGSVSGVLSVMRDISARKANERQLVEDALTDPLTGLPNRRAFEAKVNRRSVLPGALPTDCIAVLDIDHFKVVNDTHGHAVGDAVLREFARIAQQTVREHDLLARIGGEEFAIIFPDTSVDQALRICDRLRMAVAEKPMLAGAAIVRVTVSGGVATVGLAGIDHALATADRALYSAKRNGRDQLALAA